MLTYYFIDSEVIEMYFFVISIIFSNVIQTFLLSMVDDKHPNNELFLSEFTIISHNQPDNKSWML